MKLQILIILTLLSFKIDAQTNDRILIEVSDKIKNTSSMPFYTHTFNNVLALNIEYSQIKKIRKVIEEKIGQKLKFLTAWNINGEAHVTTITPPEYKDHLRFHISMTRINQIATEMEIQNTELEILGIGSGNKLIEGKVETTYFVIVDSAKLRRIRHAIFREFVDNGGNPKSFDPAWFFPHITIGYTKSDIHENSGLIKNIKHSLDNRFELKLN
jgi:2'-5' RNA ligase